MSNISIFVPLTLLAIFVQYGESIRCWACTSELSKACADPFLPGNPDIGYILKFDDCDGHSGVAYPFLATSKTVCKKQKKYVNGLLVVTRGCTWKRIDDYSTSCDSSSNGGPNEVTTYCQTCSDYDGCNSASTIGKTLALIIAPLGLLLFK